MRKYRLTMSRDLEVRAGQVAILNAARTLGVLREYPHAGRESQFVFATRDAEFAHRMGARRVS